MNSFPRKTDDEQFAVGGKYDLLFGGDRATAGITLTALVGCETDEGVGNDSFLGALGSVEELAFSRDRNYYVVRRHGDDGATVGDRKSTEFDQAPIGMDVQEEIAGLLDQRMKAEATDAEKRIAGDVAPQLEVQSFRLEDGSLRYYARASWKSGRETEGEHPFALGAWIAAAPRLRILAFEKWTTGYGD
jgi:hypothetical protein